MAHVAENDLEACKLEVRLLINVGSSPLRLKTRNEEAEIDKPTNQGRTWLIGIGAMISYLSNNQTNHSSDVPVTGIRQTSN
jgi:hypothetical protein